MEGGYHVSIARSGKSNECSQRRLWVKMRKSRNDHMSAGLPLIADIAPLLMSRSAARSRLVIVDALSSDGPLQIFAHELDMMSQHVQHACICGRDPEIVCLLL